MEKKLRVLAKNLRQKATDTENYLWLFLRNRQLEGVKFRRQEPMGRFIVDFVSYETKIVIELDGGQHSSNKEKDSERDVWLKTQGYEILRFWNNDVFKNKNGVLEVIRKAILTPHLASPSRGEGDIR